MFLDGRAELTARFWCAFAFALTDQIRARMRLSHCLHDSPDICRLRDLCDQCALGSVRGEGPDDCAVLGERPDDRSRRHGDPHQQLVGVSQGLDVGDVVASVDVVAHHFGVDLPERHEFDTAGLDHETVDTGALSLAYDNLFVVPGPRYVPPMASAHRDDPSASFESDSPFHEEGSAGELLGDPAAEMASLYERAGLRPDRGDFPDHVAAQLAFLATVTGSVAQALEDGNDEEVERFRDLQRETLAQLGWLDRFYEAVTATDGQDGAFTALVAMARTLAAWHARELDDR